MRVLLIDGLNLIRRIYAGVPEDDAGQHLAGVEDAVLRSLNRALGEHAPSHALLVMDDPNSTWRRDLFPGYKQNRKPMPAPLQAHLGQLVARVGEAGIQSVTTDGFEADDVIATIATGLATRNIPVVVLSTDKSMLGLLVHGVEVRDHFAGTRYTLADVDRRFGVPPAALPDFLALAGDSSQNVPGVRGIGTKTAAALLVKYGDLEGVLAATSELPARQSAALTEQADDARLYARISRLRTDVEVGINLNAFRLAS